jgi:hypothetical protein
VSEPKVPRKAKFRVFGKLDRASGFTASTVVVDRATGEVSVRPLRKRKTYSMTLGEIATWVCQVNIKAEVREKLARRRGKKRR